MGAYNYKALDATGKLVKGIIEGDSQRQIRQQLRSRQLKPVEVSQAHDKASGGGAKQGFALNLFKPRLSQSDLALITRQMATLIQANIPLDEVLTATSQQARKPRVKSIMLQVRARVIEGHSLAYALGDFPHVFNEMYRAMVKAGEHAGFLGTVLQQLADYTENSQYTQQKLKTAMIYPLFLTIVAVAVVSILMTLVVPQLVNLFKHTNQELPWMTEVLIVTSDFFSAYWWVMLIAVVALVVGTGKLLQRPQVRTAWHRILLKIPFISGLVTSLDTARFASTLSILVSSGVPLLEGLKIAGAVLTNTILRQASGEVATRVQEGGSLNRALSDTGVFPPMMVHMVASGEASGNLENMLERSAKNQERELEMTLGSMMGIFTPVMVLLMAAIVGAIVVAILLPIIEMNNLVV